MEKSRDHVTQDVDFQSPFLDTITPKITMWTFDTGASEHITNDITILENFVRDKFTMKCANETTCSFEGYGTFRGKVNGNSIFLEKVLYSKDINKNLIGGIKLAKEGYKMNIENANNEIILTINKIKKYIQLYHQVIKTLIKDIGDLIRHFMG